MSTLCYLFKRVKQSRKPSRTPLPSPSRGMSEAKVEQQSTETLSFRCWCERCRLMRGRRVKQSRATELSMGEGSIVVQVLWNNKL